MENQEGLGSRPGSALALVSDTLWTNYLTSLNLVL